MEKSSDHAVLLALSAEPQTPAAVAQRAGVSESEARAALERLTASSLAIEEDGAYELTGPLSWFGDFAAAIAHYAPRRFIVQPGGDPESHLYVSDVRIKGSHRIGDPKNETVAVFACGTTAGDVNLLPAGTQPTCEECSRFLTI